jgi:YD repeat-containing protein
MEQRQQEPDLDHDARRPSHEDRLCTSRRAVSVQRGSTGGPTTTYTYNSGNTVSTDPNGNATTYSYDAGLRTTSVKDALGSTRSSTYTSDSNVSTFTDAASKTWSYGYDALDNLTSSQSPLEGTTNRPLFAYGAAGGAYQYDVQKYTDAQGNSWSYAYDNGASTGPGDLTSSGGAGQTPVTFTYNSDGTTATATDGLGHVTTYAYTNHDLTSLTRPSPLGAISATYDSLHRIATLTDGKGQTRTFSYDPEDRIIKLVFTGGQTLTYGYDPDGNLTSQSDSTGSYTYHLDGLNRLTDEDLPTSTLGYTYDPASNLLVATDASGATSYTYTPDNQVATIREPGAANPIRFTYDANGNRTEIDYPNGISQCIGYDDSQRLISVVGQTATCGSVGTVLTSFTYTYGIGGLDTDLRRSMTAQYPGGSPATTYYCYTTLNQSAASKHAGRR